MHEKRNPPKGIKKRNKIKISTGSFISVQWTFVCALAFIFLPRPNPAGGDQKGDGLCNRRAGIQKSIWSRLIVYILLIGEPGPIW